MFFMLDILACAFSLEHEFFSDIKNINLFSIIDELSLLAQRYPLNRECDFEGSHILNSNICLNLDFFCKCDEILQNYNVLILY